jgi:energy-coupling factor transport system permease protein
MPKLKLDPRTKLILMLIITFSAILIRDTKMEVMVISLIAVLALLQGEDKRCAGFLLVYGATYVLLLCCKFMPQFLASMVVIVCAVLHKMLPPVMFAFCILLTAKISSLISAMQSMHIPPKITIPIAVGLRYFPTAAEEMKAIKDARKLRGINISISNLFTRPGIMLEGAVVPLMLRSANIAEELSASAIARGIDSGQKRTSIEKLQFKIPDYICLIVFAALLVLAVSGGLNIR